MIWGCCQSGRRMGFRSTEERTRKGDRSSSVPSIQELTGGSGRDRG
ncbi:DUF4157 domain-containing protein, partial [Halogeometricum borinquense]